MTIEDIKTLRMIASNCALEKVQRDMLTEIASKEEKYAWHDLKKNPKDLPEVNKVVFTYFANCEYTTNHMINTNVWAKGYYKYYDPIAWREIEPFECEVSK